MRATTPQLLGFLSNRPVTLWAADLFTFTLANGTVLRYAASDIPVSFGGNAWQNVGPTISRTSWSSKDTTGVPTMEITLGSNGADYAGQNIKALIHNGAFDGGQVQLDRAIGAVPGVPVGTVTLFGGLVSQIELGSLTTKITVKAWTVLLQQYMPRNTYQTGCIHALYDSGCTASRAAFTTTNTVLTATRNGIQTASNWLLPGGATAVVGNLLLGALTVTSGVAAGTKRTVASLGPAAGGGTGAVNFSYPLYQAPSAGDTLSCTYGCDKLLTTCTSRFNNAQHWRGFPFIPPAETAV